MNRRWVNGESAVSGIAVYWREGFFVGSGCGLDTKVHSRCSGGDRGGGQGEFFEVWWEWVGRWM